MLDRSPHCGSGDCVAVKGGFPSVKQSVGSTLLRHQELAKDIKYILLARVVILVLEFPLYNYLWYKNVFGHPPKNSQLGLPSSATKY